MKRSELEHLLRAASFFAEDDDVVVLGSQAILGTFAEDRLPDAAHASIEADVTFFNDAGNDKSDLVDMHLGEDSQFHADHDYYAQGVDVGVAYLPEAWRERLVVVEAGGIRQTRGHCLEPHDLVVAKLVAHRAKDMQFASELLHAGLVDGATLVSRARTLEVPAHRTRVVEWVESWMARWTSPESGE
jgi:hypothetical protein